MPTVNIRLTHFTGRLDVFVGKKQISESLGAKILSSSFNKLRDKFILIINSIIEKLFASINNSAA